MTTKTSKPKFDIWPTPDPNPLFNTRVYMLHMDRTDFYKIGIAANVDKRLRGIQNGNPVLVHVHWASGWLTRDDARLIELGMHFQLRNNKSKAPTQREWFILSPTLADQVCGQLATEALRKRTATEDRQHRAARIDPNSYQILDAIPENYTTARLYVIAQGFLPDEISVSQVSRWAGKLCKDASLPVLTVRISTTPRRDGSYGETAGLAFPMEILKYALGKVIR